MTTDVRSEWLVAEEIDTKETAADAQADKFRLSDFLIASVLAVVAAVHLFLWHIPGVPIANMADVTVGAGLRPASSVVGGYWNLFAHYAYPYIGDKGMSLLGGAMVVAFVALCYVIIRELLIVVMMARPQSSKSRTNVMRCAAAFATLIFMFSDLIWSIGQYFSETSVLLLLTLLSACFFLVFLRKGQLRYAFLMAFLLGLITAESLIGYILMGVFVGLYFLVISILPNVKTPLVKPAIVALGKWHLTFFFVFSVLLGAIVNCFSFFKCGGLATYNLHLGDLPLTYAVHYWANFCSVASIGGWCIWLVLILFPLVVVLLRFPSAADEEEFLSYATGFMYVVVGLVAFTQLCGIDVLWFWEWNFSPVDSCFMRASSVFMSAVTLAFVVAVFGVDGFCRDHSRLVRQFVGDDDEDIENSRFESYSPTAIMFSKLVFIVLLPVFVILAVAPGRKKSTTFEMMKMINEGVAAMVKESEDARFMFTDGSLDCAIELEARRQRKPLTCIALIGGGEQGRILRLRGMTDPADLYCFATDGGRGLRAWIQDRPKSLEMSACQMGFDLWKRDGKAIPPIGGFVSRPAGWKDAKARIEGITHAKDMIGRYLAFYKAGKGGVRVDKMVKDAFLSLQWRLSRMCFYRGENLDCSGDSTGALAEVEMSKMLDNNNETYKNLMKAIIKRNKEMSQLETPREGLLRTLSTANFKTAKLFAEMIVASHPDDVDANFALAMYYAFEKQYARAEEFFERCIKVNPNQPTFYNNIAMIQLELDKLEDALRNADLALSLIPDSAEVHDTRRKVLKAINDRKEAADKKAGKQSGT